MTINSIVPSNGSAVVTIAAETVNLELPLEDLLQLLRQSRGVIKADILAG
jgi:ACT domain-containing protein